MYKCARAVHTFLSYLCAYMYTHTPYVSSIKSYLLLLRLLRAHLSTAMGRGSMYYTRIVKLLQALTLALFILNTLSPVRSFSFCMSRVDGSYLPFLFLSLGKTRCTHSSTARALYIRKDRACILGERTRRARVPRNIGLTESGVF